MFSLSVDVLPDMQHIAYGPPSSTKPNPFHSAGRQTSHLLGIHLPWLVVRFSSHGLIPHITLSQSYLTHDRQDWPYVHMGSAHVCTRYLYIYMCVRTKPPSFGKAPHGSFFSLIRCISYSRRRIFCRIWLTARRPPGMALLAQGRHDNEERDYRLGRTDVRGPRDDA
jgi:hypothetical protein